LRNERFIITEKIRGGKKVKVVERKKTESKKKTSQTCWSIDQVPQAGLPSPKSLLSGSRESQQKERKKTKREEEKGECSGSGAHQHHYA